MIKLLYCCKKCGKEARKGFELCDDCMAKDAQRIKGMINKKKRIF